MKESALDVPTPRELAVLGLICAGHSTKEIAHRLRISFRTAACHRSRLMQKSGADNVVLLFRWAVELGYATVERRIDLESAHSPLEGASRNPAMTQGRSRQKLQGAWQQRVNRARDRYRQQVAICAELQAERLLSFPMQPSPDPDGTLRFQQALRAESAALREFARVTEGASTVVES
jgi:DNA-binding CsgD family transcriptional regulator